MELHGSPGEWVTKLPCGRNHPDFDKEHRGCVTLKNEAEVSQLPTQGSEARAATQAPLKNISGEPFLEHVAVLRDHPQPTKG